MQTLFAPATGFRSHALNLTPFTGTGIPFAPLKFPGHSQIHSAHLKYNLESRFDVGSGKFYRCHRTRVSASATPAAGGKDSWLLEFVGDGDSSHIGKRVPLPGAFELASDAATVGRLAEKADIVIPVATVSGLHARLEKKEGLLLVTDLNSTNGTYIDDKKLSPGTVTTLSPGSCITFVNIVRGGHRLATALMYLTDVAEGGETVFPSAEDDTRRPVSTKDASLSDCAKKGVAVKSKRGDALLFFSLTLGPITDPNNLHARYPIIEGEKWSATKWIHVESFDKPIQSLRNYVDENDRCGEWATYGECINNLEYMVGLVDLPSACRKRCDTHLAAFRVSKVDSIGAPPQADISNQQVNLTIQD